MTAALRLPPSLLLTVLSGIALATPAVLLAQSTPPATSRALELDPVEVLGLPILEELEVRSTADKVARVSRDQIEALHATDLADALRTVPGLTISRFNPVGSFGGGDGGAIYIRGHGNGRPGGQISLMQDGVARFTAIWTHPLLDLLSVDNVHQAEVLKSPQPVLHGNMAFGAINLIAKSATNEGTVNRLKLAAGSWGTREAVYENSYGAGPLRSHFVASHRESDGHRPNSAGELSNLSYHFGYQLNDTWSLAAFINATGSQAEDPQSRFSTPLPIVETYETESLFATLTLSHTDDAGEGYAKLYWDNGETLWFQWDGAPPPPIGAAFTNITKFQSYGLQWQESRNLADDWQVTGGYDLQVYGGDTLDDYPAPLPDAPFAQQLIRQHSVYLLAVRESESNTGDWALTPSAGLRYNWSDPFENQWGAQAGLVAQKGDTTLTAQYARAYNYAGVYTAVLNQRWGFFGLGPTDWHDIEAETLDHFELGLQHRFSPQLHVDLSLFHDRGRKALRFDPPPPPVSLTRYDRFTTRGAELTLFLEPTAELRVFAGLTVTDASPSDQPNVPGYTATLGSHWEFSPGWRLHADVQMVDDQLVQGVRFSDPPEPIDRYAQANLKLSRAYDFGSTHGRAFLAVRNVFDESFVFQPGYPAPGINWMLGFDAKF
jgi:iron complex outermembrane receptor protein